MVWSAYYMTIAINALEYTSRLLEIISLQTLCC